MSDADRIPTRGVLAGAADASQIRSVLTGACCEYGDGSGKFDADVAQAILRDLRAETLVEALSASDLDSLTWLGRALWHFFDGLPAGSCPGLIDLRAALGRELKRKLPAADGPNSLAWALNLECFAHPGGSGRIDVEAVRRLLDGYRSEQFSKSLGAGDRSSLAYLSTTLDALSAAVLPDRCDGLEQVRTAVSEALARILSVSREKLTGASNAAALADSLVAACCLNNLNQERIDAGAARELFRTLDVNRMRQVLAASDGPSLGRLGRLLNFASRALDPPCEEVEALLAATNRALELWLGIVREELDRPIDAEALADVVGNACAEYADGSGDVTVQAVRLLFDGLVAANFARGLGGSGLRSAQRMRRVLKHLRQGMQRAGAATCEGLEQAIAATTVAIRECLGDVEDAEELRTAVCSVCCEYDDGSGRIDAAATRELFEDFAADRFAEVLSRSDPPSRRKLAGILQRLALTVGHPRCEGLESLRREIPS